MKKILLLSLSIVIIVLMFGCNQSPEKAFKKAEELNTISGYEKFLKNFSNTKFNQQAEANLEILRWKESQTINTIPGYEDFINKYPNSQNVSQANESIEKLRWKDALTINTISTYEDFINRYPNSPNVDQAKNSMEKIKWVGKKIFYKEMITIQGSSNSWLVNVLASDMMQSKYIVTYEALVEDVIGDSLKVIINGDKVDMLTTNGRTSMAQHQNLAQAKSAASEMIGKTYVIEKSKAQILK